MSSNKIRSAPTGFSSSAPADIAYAHRGTAVVSAETLEDRAMLNAILAQHSQEVKFQVSTGAPIHPSMPNTPPPASSQDPWGGLSFAPGEELRVVTNAELPLHFSGLTPGEHNAPLTLQTVIGEITITSEKVELKDQGEGKPLSIVTFGGGNSTIASKDGVKVTQVDFSFSKPHLVTVYGKDAEGNPVDSFQRTLNGTASIRPDEGGMGSIIKIKFEGNGAEITALHAMQQVAVQQQETPAVTLQEAPQEAAPEIVPAAEAASSAPPTAPQETPQTFEKVWKAAPITPDLFSGDFGSSLTFGSNMGNITVNAADNVRVTRTGDTFLIEGTGGGNKAIVFPGEKGIPLTDITFVVSGSTLVIVYGFDANGESMTFETELTPENPVLTIPQTMVGTRKVKLVEFTITGMNAWQEVEVPVPPAALPPTPEDFDMVFADKETLNTVLSGEGETVTEAETPSAPSSETFQIITPITLDLIPGDFGSSAAFASSIGNITVNAAGGVRVIQSGDTLLIQGTGDGNKAVLFPGEKGSPIAQVIFDIPGNAIVIVYGFDAEGKDTSCEVTLTKEHPVLTIPAGMPRVRKLKITDELTLREIKERKEVTTLAENVWTSEGKRVDIASSAGTLRTGFNSSVSFFEGAMKIKGTDTGYADLVFLEPSPVTGAHLTLTPGASIQFIVRGISPEGERLTIFENLITQNGIVSWNLPDGALVTEITFAPSNGATLTALFQGVGEKVAINGMQVVSQPWETVTEDELTAARGNLPLLLASFLQKRSLTQQLRGEADDHVQMHEATESARKEARLLCALLPTTPEIATALQGKTEEVQALLERWSQGNMQGYFLSTGSGNGQEYVQTLEERAESIRNAMINKLLVAGFGTHDYELESQEAEIRTFLTQNYPTNPEYLVALNWALGNADAGMVVAAADGGTVVAEGARWVAPGVMIASNTYEVGMGSKLTYDVPTQEEWLAQLSSNLATPETEPTLHSYLVSRPLQSPPFNIFASHMFIVTGAKFLGDPDATIHSFGRNEKGILGRVNDSTYEMDRAAWRLLATEFNPDGIATIDVQEIQASSELVEQYACTLTEEDIYSLLGPNSNSAAQAIANKAARKNVSTPEARSAPGAEDATEVEFESTDHCEEE